MASKNKVTGLTPNFKKMGDKQLKRSPSQLAIAKSGMKVAKELLIPRTPTDVALMFFPYGKAVKAVGKGIKTVKAANTTKKTAATVKVVKKGANATSKLNKKVR